ncbi:hypothetical protein B4094_3362 [Bacillus licheniformis]|nr:hypothetical protein B4094_3362 [Bacillus licheniformis]TWN03348.1 hypothetical protein CHCC14566_1189 [Bacillus licheniformis]
MTWYISNNQHISFSKTKREPFPLLIYRRKEAEEVSFF